MDTKCSSGCADTGATLEAQEFVCLCPDTLGGLDYHSSCGACHSTCDKCFLSNDRTSCTNCPSGSTPQVLLVGACQCTSPGVLKSIVNTDNVPVHCTFCSNGCDYCISSDLGECFTQAQRDFLNYIHSSFSLPLLTETSNHLMCYFQRRPTWDTTTCTGDPIQNAVGAINNYDSPTNPATPLKSQCYKLLRAEWLAITHWFAQLFTPFNPTGASDSDKNAIKSIIYLWILQFGPNEMRNSDWDDLKTALTSTGSDWTKFLAWVGSDPGYLTDGTNASKKPFPPTLLNWLKSASGCGGLTAGCGDLQVFNLKSTVCSDPSCTVKSRCQEVDASSNCVTSGTGSDV